MKITIHIHSNMERFFPALEFEVKLKEGAQLSDLYEEIGRVAGAEISPAVWNNEKSRPRGPVILRSENGVLKKDTTLLHEGQVVELKRFLIGG